MKNLQPKIYMKSLIVFVLFTCIFSFAHAETGIAVDTVRVTTTISPQSPTPTNALSAINDQMKIILPEMLSTFCVEQADINKSIKDFATSISKLSNEFKRFAKKNKKGANEVEVKKLLAKMKFKIGGTKFDTRPLSPQLIAAFTPANIRELTDNLDTLSLKIELLSKQNNLMTQLEALKGFKNIIEKSNRIQIGRILFEEYSTWMKEMVGEQNKPKTVEVTVAPPVVDEKQKAINARNRAIFDSAYIMLPEQIKISDIPYVGGNEIKLVRIERGKSATNVTFAIPIHFESNWISTDTTSCIVDKMTNECYVPRAVANNIPMSKIIIVKGCKQKMIEITYIYPPVSKSTRFVDIVDIIKSPLEMPSNSAENTQFYNIDIDNFDNTIKKPARKFIR